MLLFRKCLRCIRPKKFSRDNLERSKKRLGQLSKALNETLSKTQGRIELGENQVRAFSQKGRRDLALQVFREVRIQKASMARTSAMLRNIDSVLLAFEQREIAHQFADAVRDAMGSAPNSAAILEQIERTFDDARDYVSDIGEIGAILNESIDGGVTTPSGDILSQEDLERELNEFLEEGQADQTMTMLYDVPPVPAAVPELTQVDANAKSSKEGGEGVGGNEDEAEQEEYEEGEEEAEEEKTSGSRSARKNRKKIAIALGVDKTSEDAVPLLPRRK